MAPTWQDYLTQYGPLIGEILGTATSGKWMPKTPYQSQFGGRSSYKADPSIGAGIDTQALSSGQSPYANTENMSVNKPEAYSPSGEGMMSTAAPQPAGEQPKTKTGGANIDYANLMNTVLNLYGIAKSGNPNEARGEFAKSYGMDSSELPEAPESASRKRRAGHTVGTAALNFIPVVGPYASAAGGMLGDEKIAGDLSEWYHALMSRNPALRENPKLQTPDVQESGRQKARRVGRSVGSAVAGYFGGPIVGALAGGVKQKADESVAERRAKQAENIALRNQDIAKQSTQEANRRETMNQAVANQFGSQSAAGNPELQALMMLLGGQA